MNIWLFLFGLIAKSLRPGGQCSTAQYRSAAQWLRTTAIMIWHDMSPANWVAVSLKDKNFMMLCLDISCLAAMPNSVEKVAALIATAI